MFHTSQQKKDMVKLENYGLKVSVTTLLSCETFNPKTLAIDQRAKYASNWKNSPPLIN